MNKIVVHIISRLSNTGPVNVLYNLLMATPVKERENIKIVSIAENFEGSRSEDFINLGINVIFLDLNNYKSYFLFGSKIKPILDKENAFIIHSHCFRSILLSSSYLSKTYKCISSIQNNFFYDYPKIFGKMKGGIMAKLEARALENMNSIVCCSCFVEAEMRNQLKNINIKCINNGVEEVNNTFTSKSKIISRKTLNISNTEKVFIFIGSLDSRKNPLVLLKAFINILKLNNNITLIVLGDGELRDECNLIVSDFKEKIKLYGNVPDIHPYLQAADFYVSSSLSEGMPTVVMNAMSYGIPSVLSNISPHIEMFKSLSDYDHFFSPEQIENIEEIILGMLEIDYEDLSKSIYNVFNKNFSSKIMYINYAKEYDSI